MNIKNCRNCGKMFNYITGPAICPNCREAVEAKFQEVKEYIREHKGVGIAEVSEACSVDPGQIRQWLRDDRLEVTEDSIEGDKESALKNIKSLKEKGFRVALDDFSSGYTAVSNLYEYSVDLVKIDRQMIIDAERDPRNKELN